MTSRSASGPDRLIPAFLPASGAARNLTAARAGRYNSRGGRCKHWPQGFAVVEASPRRTMRAFRIVVAGHGDLAAALVAAAEMICGRIPDLHPVALHPA